MKPKIHFVRLKAVFAHIGAIFVLFFAATASTEAYNAYEGCKVPLLDIPFETSYSYQHLEALRSKMAYVEANEGDPIPFPSGQPTPSYLRLNIVPHLKNHGRVTALNNIRFGKSDQPHLDYSFHGHYRNYDAYVTKPKLRNTTLFGQDWRSDLGLHSTRLYQDNIKAIVTMEPIIVPLVPAKNYGALPHGLAEYFHTSSAPRNSSKLTKENYFIENTLRDFTVQSIHEATHNVYGRPFVTEKSS